MPVSFPPQLALDQFLGAVTRHTRRVEIYESDGITRWEKDTVSRLKSGNITVDQTRDERRSLDLVLANDDGVLQNAPGEFWYDKIIKVYRGVIVNEPVRIPHILILSDKTGGDALGASMRSLLTSNGFGDAQINVLASDYTFDIEPFDIIVGLGNASAAQIDLLTEAFRAGKSVFVQDDDAISWIIDAYPSATSLTGVANSVVAPKAGSTHPVAQSWSSFTPSLTDTTTVYTSTSTEWTQVSEYAANTAYSRIIAFQDPIHGGRAVTFSFGVNVAQYNVTAFRTLTLNAIRWLNTVKPLTEWEVQIGEFMIDRISEPNFPYEVKITGRDYTKRCVLSKFTAATQFIAGMALESVIGSIASNAGITKRLMPATGVVIGRDFYFERNTSRWEAMKEIATAFNYEIYFDAQGYLVLRPFNDPSTTPPILYINTGVDGQMASYEKSTSDTRLFNHVMVISERTEADALLLHSEIINTDANSPTNISRIGDRYHEYTSAFIETQAQADAVAQSFYAISSLEEFELSFDTLVLPWLEAGDIIGWIDPRPAAGDPDIFLLSSFSIPLGLSPMSGSAKRVTIV